MKARRGFCQIIVNRQKHEALLDEEVELSSVFQDLGFDVHKAVCGPKDDVETIINSLARGSYRDNTKFVCFILSNITENWETESFDKQSLSVTKLMARFTYGPLSLDLLEQPKIFIIQGKQNVTALETDEAVKESFTVALPPGKNFLCLFVPYRKGYISTLLSVIKMYGSNLDLLSILSVAKKLFYEKSHITIPDPVHNFKGKVYLQ